MLTVMACFVATVLAAAAPADAGRTEIHWLTNYDEAIKESTATNKYMLIVFTGSDWCPWCQKLDREVLSTDEFAEMVGSKFVFLKIDFPTHTKITSAQQKHNNDLKEKYGVKGFPTLIILDEKQQKINTIGYRAGGAKAYADYLQSTIADYNSYNKKLQSAMSQSPSSDELKTVYEQACRLGQDDDKATLMAAGQKSENPVFFLKERYRLLVQDGKISSEEAKQVRSQLSALDPSNEHGSQLSIAVIEYQRLAEELDQQKCDASTACAPLIAYIEKFGSQDKEHLWRMQMTVAQTFMSQNQSAEALSYAKASYDTAPDIIRPEIANTIRQIEDTLSATR